MLKEVSRKGGASQLIRAARKDRKATLARAVPWALPRPKSPRATEADAVAETKKAAKEEAVTVAEAMKDGTTAGKPISSKENVLIGRLFFNTRGLTA